MYSFKNLILIGWVLLFTFFAQAQEDSIQDGSIRSLIMNGKYKTVIDSLEPTISDETTFSSYYNLGIAYEKSGLHYKALWAFESALKIDPSSSEAQHNASFVYGKIAKNESWTHPFSWTERMIVAFKDFWTPLLIVSVLVLALIIFLHIGKINVSKLNWIRNTWLLWLFLSGIALISINQLKNHYAYYQYMVIEHQDQPVFLNPSGIPVEDEVILPIRAPFESFNEDSSYISFHLNQETYWIKNEQPLVY